MLFAGFEEDAVACADDDRAAAALRETDTLRDVDGLPVDGCAAVRAPGVKWTARAQP
jgi:hypothetical protein